jgi:hypothetical protein
MVVVLSVETGGVGVEPQGTRVEWMTFETFTRFRKAPSIMA